MLGTYLRHIWLCLILITLSSDTEKNPGPKPNFGDKLSRYRWNLNSISAHNFTQLSPLRAYVSTHNFDVLCLSETYLDSSISCNFIVLYLPPSQSQDDFETCQTFEVKVTKCHTKTHKLRA